MDDLGRPDIRWGHGMSAEAPWQWHRAIFLFLKSIPLVEIDFDNLLIRFGIRIDFEINYLDKFEK